MAFDGTKNDASLNREILIRELRENPPEWWYFNDCRRCAIEVGARLGLVTDLTSPVVPLMRAFGLSSQNVMRTFYITANKDKTPADVADELEAAPYV